MTVAKHRVWVLDEGHAGHRNQSLGLTDRLSALIPLDVEIVPAHLTVPGLLRLVLRACLALPTPCSRLTTAAYTELQLPAGKPDIIISSGGRTVPLAFMLRRRFRCRHVFLGEIHPFSGKAFDIVLAPTRQARQPDSITTNLLITRVSPQSCRRAGQQLLDRLGLPDRQRLAALLIGGPSRSHQFTTRDWSAIANGVNELHARHGWKWLITSSPRTPCEAEQQLRHAILPEAIADAAWWHTTPRKVVDSYLGAAQRLYVTGDSLTMISEAVASGKDVMVLTSEKIRHSDYIEGTLKAAIDNNILKRITCSDLASIDHHPERHGRARIMQQDSYLKPLLALLQLD